MKLENLASKIFSGQIMTRIIAKEEAGEEVIKECKVLAPKAIVNGRVVHNDLSDAQLKKEIDSEKLTQVGDIVIKLATPYDAAYIDEKDAGLVVSSFCVIIRGLNEDRIDSKFLTAYLNTDYVINSLKAKVAGTTMPMLKLGDIKEINIPELPLERQMQISEVYTLSCSKQELLQQLLDNEKELMRSIILKSVLEGMKNEA